MAPVLTELDLRNTELEAARQPVQPHPQDVHSSQGTDGTVTRHLATMLAGDYEGALDTGGPEPTYDAYAERFPAIPLVPAPVPPVRQLYSASDHEAAISAVRHDAETSDEEDLGEQMWQVMHPTDVSWRSAWFEAGEEPLMDDQESCITVWAWAALCVSNFCAGSCTIEQLDASLKAVPRIWPDGRYPCRADNPLARFPQSMRACEAAIGVRPIVQHELHVCWTDGCTHWWRHTTHRSHKTPDGHVCPSSCRNCVCPQCGSMRWGDGPRKGIARKCYFFPQAIESFFLDPVMCNALLRTRTEQGPPEARTAPFHRSRRYAELRQACINLGLDPNKVCCDGSHLAIHGCSVRRWCIPT